MFKSKKIIKELIQLKDKYSAEHRYIIEELYNVESAPKRQALTKIAQYAAEVELDIAAILDKYNK